MLDRVQIENGWREWVNAKAEEHKFSETDKFALQDAIAKEVQWILDTAVAPRKSTLKGRLMKYEYMKQHSLARIHDFDRFWEFKVDFFNFILQSHKDG